MPTVEVDGYSLDYTDDGSGDPVVFVHGGFSDRRNWDAQRAVLCKQFRVIAFSRRFHWPNAPVANEADYSADRHVEDLDQIIRALEIAPCHLIGNSYGGYLSLMVAIRQPELVRTLVLAEPPVIPLVAGAPPKPHKLLRLFLTKPRTAISLFKFFATGIGPATAALRRGDNEAGVRIFIDGVIGPGGYDGMSTARMELLRDNRLPEQLTGPGFAPMSRDEVLGVRIPVLLVTGQKSPISIIRLTDLLQELLPDSERVEIPNASHDMHFDNPEAFNAAVTSFLERRSRETALPRAQAIAR